jgi:hypothetical protein
LVTKVLAARTAVPDVTAIDCPTTIPGLATVNVIVAEALATVAEEPTAPAFDPKPNVSVTGVPDAAVVALVIVKAVPEIADT